MQYHLAVPLLGVAGAIEDFNKAIELEYSNTINSDLSLLSSDIEIQLINTLISFPDYIKSASIKLEPQIIINYLQNLALLFHRFYSKNRVLTENRKLSNARLNLIQAIKIVLKNRVLKNRSRIPNPT